MKRQVQVSLPLVAACTHAAYRAAHQKLNILKVLVEVFDFLEV
jgi:hypothetical protein